MKRKTDALEVASGSLQAELIEIKERLGSLETITSLANRKEVEGQARSLLTSEARKDIMKLCETPKTKAELQKELSYPSSQGLDHHLNPLRGGDLIHQKTDDRGILTFEWSRLFKSLPKQTKNSILGESSGGRTRQKVTKITDASK